MEAPEKGSREERLQGWVDTTGADGKDGAGKRALPTGTVILKRKDDLKLWQEQMQSACWQAPAPRRLWPRFTAASLRTCRKHAFHTLKSQLYTGNPAAGSVEFKRFVNSASKAYGTARAAAKGDKVTAPLPR